jgi:photosystem II PsbY protein
MLLLRVHLVCRLSCTCRLATIGLLFLPALGWVAFNMFQPAFNQLNRMSEKKDEVKGSSGGKKKRGLAGAVGMGAALSMLAAQQADAATELSQLAASDNRCGVLGQALWRMACVSAQCVLT